jgi:predicted nucleotidyltransferase
MYLDSFIDDINAICLQNKVRSLYVFGSVLTRRFTKKSDIDFVVEIDAVDPFEYADRYFNLKFALQDLLNRDIDLLENKAIKNPYVKKNIFRTSKLIYER